MEITREDIKIVQSSWVVLAPNSQELAMKFYNGLFEENPELGPMFKGGVEKQAEKLMFTLAFIITNLDRIQEITKSIEELGRVHAKSYKVMNKHYPIVKKHLISSIQDQMKNDWTEEHYTAWHKVISLVERSMIKGASKKEGVAWKFWK